MDRKALRALKEAELTYEKASAEFRYDPELGHIYRRSDGERIGLPSRQEYNYGSVRWPENDKIYQAHRLAWLLHYGEWPKGVVDHKDGDPGNNRIENLRDCTHAQNIANQRRRTDNKSGVKGVYWDASRKKWHAQIVKEVGTSKSRSLGRFNTIEEAAAAYAKAANDMYAEFARLA